MSVSARLGISHSLDPNASIIHSTIMGKLALGRVSDLMSIWCSKELALEVDHLGGLRILIQALLEFACPGGKSSLGQIELGATKSALVIATRFECNFRFESGSIEKDLTQYWLNSDHVKLLKKVLNPHDRVEVRYLTQLNLIEWRVYRGLSLESNENHDSSFLVLTDEASSIEAGTQNYIDLGDLPHDQWLAEVYRNRNEKSNSGEVRFEADITQDESEWARVITDRESEIIDQSVNEVLKNLLLEEEINYKYSSGFEEEILKKSSRYSDETVSQLMTEQLSLKENLKKLILEMKQRTLKDTREVVGHQKKMNEFEKLLKRKELIIQKNQAQMQVLQSKVEDGRKKKGSEEKVNDFRAKALEMFEMLKEVKEENTNLQSLVSRLKANQGGERFSDPSIAVQKQMEELSKKVERTTRALDAEKIKVQSLSERVMVAEKAAQSTTPMVKDLESKVEHTLKAAQQHKKETDSVKQKLVQAEAEKNKIKNELMKTQAQIQTLMKRQAA